MNPGPLNLTNVRLYLNVMSLQLANVNEIDITTSFSFKEVVPGIYHTKMWTLSTPAGYDNTVANTINNPNLIAPMISSITNLTAKGSTVSGTLIVPGWSAVVLVSDLNGVLAPRSWLIRVLIHSRFPRIRKYHRISSTVNRFFSEVERRPHCSSLFPCISTSVMPPLAMHVTIFMLSQLASRV
jgi:hypothetical protein